MTARRLWILTAIFLGTASLPGWAQTTQRLTLKDAEKIALQNHPQIRAAEFVASAAKAVTTEFRSAYFPLLFGSLTGVEAEHGSRIAAGGLSNPIIFNRYANGITAGQLITDFGRTENLVHSSDLRAQAVQQNVTATRADVLLHADLAFFSVQRAQAVLRVAQETVKARQTVADQVTALAQSKLKSGLDVSFANVNLAEAKLLLVQAQNDLQASFAELSAALGYTDDRRFELEDEPLPSSPPPDLSHVVDEAFHERPDLAGRRLDVDAAHSFARAERDLWFPTISLVGSAGLIPYRQVTLPTRYAAAGVNVNIPIFNGRLFSARRAEADFRAQAEDQQLKDLQNGVARDVRVAWLKANTAYQRLDLTTQLLNEATEALHLAQARYDLGLSSIVELSQAQLNETEAELEQARAKYDYQSQLAALNYQMGLLR